MKILIISDAWHPQVNGVVRTYEELERVLVSKGHIVRIMGPDDFPLSCPMPGYSEIRLVPGPYGRLKRLIRDFKADHLHIGTEGPLGMAARRYCLKNNLPFTTCYHTQFPEYVARRVRRFFPRWTRYFYTLAWNHIRRFHAPSHATMVATPSIAALLKEKGFENPVCLFTRGVDTSIFHPGPRTLFHELPGPIALYVGRIAIEKSIEDFLEMPWHGSKIVVGDGPLKETLSARHPDVVFTGKRTGQALADHYRSADVFVFPSRTDTFGMVLIEAMACGLPIAAYPTSGPIDIVTEPYLGVLGDDLSVATKQAVMLINADLRHAHVCAHYTWDVATDQFLKAI